MVNRSSFFLHHLRHLTVFAGNASAFSHIYLPFVFHAVMAAPGVPYPFSNHMVSLPDTFRLQWS